MATTTNVLIAIAGAVLTAVTGCSGETATLTFNDKTVNGVDEAIQQARSALDKQAAATGMSVDDARCYLRLDTTGFPSGVQCLPVTFRTEGAFDAVAFPATLLADDARSGELKVQVQTDQPPTPITFTAGTDRFVPELPESMRGAKPSTSTTAVPSTALSG